MDHLKKISSLLVGAAADGSLSQSVLLVGRQGVGKFSIALDVAAALLCENEKSGCGLCRSCRDVRRLAHPDFLLLFPFPNLKPESRKETVFPFSDPVSSSARFSEDTRDEVERFREIKMADPYAIVDFEKKENIPVETVKDLIRALSRKPLRGGRRVVVVLDIDKMAFGAADLFLKTVEEPPVDTHLVLTTSRPDTLLPTLLSRTHIVKAAPAEFDDLERHLREKLDIKEGEAAYLSRMSGGSPGWAAYLHESEIIKRREKVLGFFSGLDGEGSLNLLIDRVNSEYSSKRPKYEDIKLDFEIMESFIHDLYLSGQNDLDKYLINVDIKKELMKMGRPEPEALDIWRLCCAETKRAFLVNNVAAGSAMAFFYISCARALNNPVGIDFKLP